MLEGLLNRSSFAHWLVRGSAVLSLWGCGGEVPPAENFASATYHQDGSDGTIDKQDSASNILNTDSVQADSSSGIDVSSQIDINAYDSNSQDISAQTEDSTQKNEDVSKNNCCPQINNVLDLTMNEGETLSVQIKASDCNKNDKLQYVINSDQIGITIDSEGKINYSAGCNSSGVYPVAIAVSDGLCTVIEKTSLIIKEGCSIEKILDGNKQFGKNISCPMISGNNIAFVVGDKSSKVYLMDIDGKVKPFELGDYNDLKFAGCKSLDISKHGVVFSNFLQDGEDRKHNLFVYNLSSGKVEKLLNIVYAGNSIHPSIDDNGNIVYKKTGVSNTATGTEDVFMRNSKGIITQITSTVNVQEFAPVISNGYIAYHKNVVGIGSDKLNDEVAINNLNGTWNKSFTFLPSSSWTAGLSINQSYFAFSISSNGGQPPYTIHLFNLNNNNLTQIEPGKDNVAPCLDDSKVIYQQYQKNKGMFIMSYDIGTGKTTNLSENFSWSLLTTKSCDDGKVVFKSNNNLYLIK